MYVYMNPSVELSDILLGLLVAFSRSVSWLTRVKVTDFKICITCIYPNFCMGLILYLKFGVIGWWHWSGVYLSPLLTNSC